MGKALIDEDNRNFVLELAFRKQLEIAIGLWKK